MLRIVIDTNVLVSAIIWQGKPRDLVLKLLEEHTVILSPLMLAEFVDVIARDKFTVKSSQVNRFLSDLKTKTKMVKDNVMFTVISEDADDDIVLNTAYTGKADYIVTGDKHLLAVRKFKKTQIVNVTEMLEIVN